MGGGMGLRPNRQIIAEHKGYMRIDGIEGFGTKVLIRIPRTVDSNTTTIRRRNHGDSG